MSDDGQPSPLSAGTPDAINAFMNVKFTASPDQVLDYLRRANATYYLEFQIEERDYRVLAAHSLTAAPAKTDKPELSCLTSRTGILSQPWFQSV